MPPNVVSLEDDRFRRPPREPIVITPTPLPPPKGIATQGEGVERV